MRQTAGAVHQTLRLRGSSTVVARKRQTYPPGLVPEDAADAAAGGAGVCPGGYGRYLRSLSWASESFRPWASTNLSPLSSIGLWRRRSWLRPRISLMAGQPPAAGSGDDSGQPHVQAHRGDAAGQGCSSIAPERRGSRPMIMVPLAMASALPAARPMVKASSGVAGCWLPRMRRFQRVFQ